MWPSCNVAGKDVDHTTTLPATRHQCPYTGDDWRRHCCILEHVHANMVHTRNTGNGINTLLYTGLNLLMVAVTTDVRHHINAEWRI